MSTDATPWSDKSQELARLLARTALGDRAAFATLYERSSGQLFAVVLRIQRDRALAEDLLQDVYVKVWHAAGGFDAARSQPMTWLASIARNRAIDSLRRAQTQPMLLSTTRDEGDGDDDGPDAVERAAADGPGPMELLDRACDARELHRCVERLSAAQKQSVALAFFDGLSYAEVAEHLKQPLGTVKSWLRRALAALKGCLDDALTADGGDAPVAAKGPNTASPAAGRG
jgi:RNA polymerase sigma factor (sigma-70 family)